MLYMSDNNEPWVASTSFNELNVEVDNTVPIQKLVLKSDGTVEVVKTESIPDPNKITIIEVSAYEDFYPFFAFILLALSLGTGIAMTAYTLNIFVGLLSGFVVLAISCVLLKVVAPESKKLEVPVLKEDLVDGTTVTTEA